MSDKKNLNPLAISVGIALGAAGALFFSKKANRAKVAKAMKKLNGKSGNDLLSKVSKVFTDVSTLADQKDLDKETKKKHK